MFVVCFVRRCLCDGLITHAKEPYRVYVCLIVCDLETSKMRRTRTESGSSTTEKRKLNLLLWHVLFFVVFVLSLCFWCWLYSYQLYCRPHSLIYSHRTDGYINSSTAYRFYQSLYPRVCTRVKIVSNPKGRENWEKGDQEIIWNWQARRKLHH